MFPPSACWKMPDALDPALPVKGGELKDHKRVLGDLMRDSGAEHHEVCALPSIGRGKVRVGKVQKDTLDNPDHPLRVLFDETPEEVRQLPRPHYYRPLPHHIYQGCACKCYLAVGRHDVFNVASPGRRW